MYVLVNTLLAVYLQYLHSSNTVTYETRAILVVQCLQSQHCVNPCVLPQQEMEDQSVFICRLPLQTTAAHLFTQQGYQNLLWISRLVVLMVG